MLQNEKIPYWVNNPTSRRLYDAYRRILAGSPLVIKKTARMTLSSVATEAGFQRSTLSKRKFPDLADLIAENSGTSPGRSITAMYDSKRALNRKLRSEIEAIKEQRDVLLNRLIALELRHVEITAERLRSSLERGSSNVFPINSDLDGY